MGPYASNGWYPEYDHGCRQWKCVDTSKYAIGVLGHSGGRFKYSR